MKKILLSLSLLLLTSGVFSQSINNLKIVISNSNEFIIAIDNQLHNNYGFMYPITYEFILPNGSSNLNVYKKTTKNEGWNKITEKSTGDFYNGIEVVRFEYDSNKAFVSVAFAPDSDSLFLKITDLNNNIIYANYFGVCKYYDDRAAVVTGTADDWDWGNFRYFSRMLSITRRNKIWISCGIVTNRCNSITWNSIQTQLDSGYVAAISHSRSHPHFPYPDTESEVGGSKLDIIENLELPGLFKRNEDEFVYVYIYPYGNWSSVIDIVAGEYFYLINRTVNGNMSHISDWDYGQNLFSRIGFVHEIGPNNDGVTDLNTLNERFDEVSAEGGIYHFMTHPRELNADSAWEKKYFENHMNYIGERKNIWYVAFGHLYLYQLIAKYEYVPIDLRSNIIVRAKVFLQGPYDSLTSKMDTSLKLGNYIPAQSPYSDSLSVGSVSNVPNNVVDWIYMELRSTYNGSTVDSTSAFLTNYGKVVNTNGVDTLVFPGHAVGFYYIVIHHRNHLAIMTADSIEISDSTALYDFTKDSNKTYGSEGIKELETGIWGMWAGDANGDGNIKYNGALNDKNSILAEVGLTTPNDIIPGYSNNDITMDSLVKYNGSSNDKNMILANVGLLLPNNIITTKVPNKVGEN